MSQRSCIERLFFPALLGFAACIGFGSSASAHPHVWATVRSEIIVDQDQRITGIRHAWTFDEFYTAMALEGLDTNGDGAYSKDELKPLAEVNVTSLKEFDFFTFVHLGNADDPLPLKPPIDYWVEFDKTLLTLHFTLPLEKPLSASGKDVQVDVYDPSFFVAFGFAKEEPVKIAGNEVPGCSAAIKAQDPDSEDTKAISEAFFSQLGPDSNFGSQFAQTAIVKCAKR
ncbi:MAG: DUF1007 family protein [Methyloceanibacter sp.]|uniref:DUF1007 family protein n=1 Tax=Methyloceanibacter sp. TaxID=1965321 RepID=UPI003D9BDEF5